MSSDELSSPVKSGMSGSLSDRVYEKIYQNITLGEWPLGTRLPTEVELATAYGVSRPVVREALLRLRIDGIIESRQGAGTRVINMPNRSVLEFAEPGSIADLQRCYEFRVGVEGEAAYLAALRHSAERIADIELAHKRMQEAMSEADAFGGEEDINFHLAVARATENSYYIATIESATKAIMVGIKIARTLSRWTNEERITNAVAEHARLLEIIKSGDADRARSAMRAHIEGARERVFLGR
ncbi:FadR/GntR family transcriptional regulator [Chelativorans sp. AA-79]|uniref:FadR/GntR family transcriptional regulator n=1 Tax=Chelativorans sp. AA-79 TaxID=3028735 RepID=UPI0023F9DCFF|nr:FadR/GntR family transcriptional regulator [Chelativorans sp. AA-79]WEX08695.1 FadR/GntR family transcriptional regulator [Chelativorans sp. AA-79]